MWKQSFPVIDPVATGRNILRLRKERGLSVRDIQEWFNFEEPRAIYKWQSGQTLPSVDNLYALSVLLDVPMNEILIDTNTQASLNGSRAAVCEPVFISEELWYNPINILLEADRHETDACMGRSAADVLRVCMRAGAARERNASSGQRKACTNGLSGFGAGV